MNKKLKNLKIVILTLAFILILSQVFLSASIAEPITEEKEINNLGKDVESIVIDHNSVDLYDDIPPEYIEKVKKMRLNLLGESHARGYGTGLEELENINSLYSVINSGSPVAEVNDKLRFDRGISLNLNGSYTSHNGEAIWFTNDANVQKVKNYINWSNTDSDGKPIDAIGFGWCWDMTRDAPSSGIDPDYGIHWFGSTVGGPDGSKAWGLNEADFPQTGNSINMDTYLNVTQSYQEYIDGLEQDTRVFFTTGPVDGGGNRGERGYQRYIKHEYMRDYVNSHPGTILFDYADILTHNDAGEVNEITWNGHTYPFIHGDNAGNYSGHIGQNGNLRLGKALWVMMARIAGWDGQTGDPTNADLYDPVSRLQTVELNSNVIAENSIANVSALPDGTVFAFKSEVDTSSTGNKDAVVVVTYPDNSVDEVVVVIEVIDSRPDSEKYEPTAKSQTVGLNATPEAENSIANVSALPSGTTFAFKSEVDTSSIGNKNAVVVATYPDNSVDEVAVVIQVIDSRPDSEKYEPTTKSQTVELNATPAAENSIANVSALPSGTTFAFKSEVDTSSTGNIDAVVVVTYPDNSVDEVAVVIHIVNSNPYSERYEPLTKEQSVRLNEEVLAVNNILNVDELPDGTTFEFESEIATDKVENYDVEVKVTYPDASYDTVFSVVRVKNIVNRLSGKNRFDTAIEISKESYKKTDNVVLVNAYNYPDALSGVPLAKKLNAPILLTQTGELNEKTKAEIERLEAKNVYILGGKGVVSNSVAAEVDTLVSGEVIRIGGKTRIETSKLVVAEVLKDSKDKTLYIANAYNYPDSLSGGAVASSKENPVLLTKPNKIGKDVKALIKSKKIKNVVVVGGKGVISEELFNELTTYGKDVVRLSGKNRYETSLEVAKSSDQTISTVYFASGRNFPDALTGSVLAGKEGSVVLLVSKNDISEKIVEYIESLNTVRVGYILGGKGVISIENEQRIKSIIE